MGSTATGAIDADIEQQTVSSSFKSAMEALSSLSYDRKTATPSVRAARFKLMSEYLKILGLEEKIEGLKIIHVAGTKGKEINQLQSAVFLVRKWEIVAIKGSTCTFSEAILRHCGFRTGLFTSPHLIDIRERFRINGLDISMSNFLHHFWDCWHRLKEKSADGLLMPMLFHFLLLVAFKIFLAEKVDVVILEVGLGGRWDSTNVVKRPIVCGITSLGMDHMEILGDTLVEIASAKAGIFKSGVPAYTVPQQSEAMSVLQDRAVTLMIPLNIASPLQPKMLRGLKLGLDGLHQFTNASLAVALCRCWLEQTQNQLFFTNDDMDASLPEPFLQGLCTASIAGRAQIVHDKLEKSLQMVDMDENSSNLVFYLDAAHTPESMEICATWFSDSLNKKQNSPNVNMMDEFYPLNVVMDGNNCGQNASNKIPKRILIFNCMDVRDPQLLFPPFIKTCAREGIYFSKAIFVHSIVTLQLVDPPVSVDTFDSSIDVSWQSTLQKAWEKIIHGEDMVPENDSHLEKPYNLPSYDFLHGNSENCNPMGNNFMCSAVSPSLPLTIKWLRDCAKENPSFQLQVLVTGSVHLVGDVLKLLGR